MRNKKEFFNAEKRKQIKKKKDLTRSLDNQVKISQRKQNKKDKERETGKKWVRMLQRLIQVTY